MDENLNNGINFSSEDPVQDSITEKAAEEINTDTAAENNGTQIIAKSPAAAAPPPANYYLPVQQKAPRLKFPFGYFAIILVVCIVISSLSGAGGAFFMYRLINNTSAYTEESTGENFNIEENLTAEGTGIREEESTLTPTFNPEETTAEEQTAEATTQAPSLTKGDIYAIAVHSVVAIRAQWDQPYSTLFGTYTKTYATTGTGFVLNNTGYIATNHHVVEKGTTLTVTDYDGNTYPAVLVGSEPSNDFAIIKIEANTIPVTLGKSSSLKVGDDIMVIGNALGELSYSFTDGIVSHLSRNVKVESGEVINMFQTNAAINNGNSGGPVYNMNGEVVGIASAKYASDTIEGLGFCIPIDDVYDMISDIILHGYVTGKPSLGVSVQTVTQALANRYSIPTGCYVVDIDTSSSAYSAGLRTGDVITAIDGTKIASCDELSAVLSAYNASSGATLEYYRKGQQFSVSVIFSEAKPSEARTRYSDVYDF